MRKLSVREQQGVERETAIAFRAAVIGWRENDWPEGFCRRTAELLVERATEAEGNVAMAFEIMYPGGAK